MPAAAIILTSFFILIGFPYHLLTDRIAHQVETALGTRIDIGDTNLRIGLFGPAFEFTDVRVSMSSGEDIELDRALLRPAWSLSWFSGIPEIFIDTETPLGAARGTLRIGNAPRWRGELLDVQLDEIPYLNDGSEFTLKGVVNVHADVVFEAQSPVGNVSFNAREGLIGHPLLPGVIEYETFVGALELGGENSVVFHDVALSGKDTELKIGGSIGNAVDPDERPVDIEITIERLEPTLKMIVRSMGARLANEGPTLIHVEGTIASPQIR